MFLFWVTWRDESNSCQTILSFDGKNQLPESIMEHNFSIKAILEPELYTTPPLIPVAVARIIGTKKDIPKAFRLTKSLSTDDLKHLRRVRDLPDDSGLECILCKITTTSIDDQNEEIKKLESKFATEDIFSDYRITNVPSSAPRTEHQLKACGPIWPCKYAKCNYLIQCIEGTLFSDQEKLVIKIIINNLLNHIKDESNETKAGAVVFRYAKVYGVGLSSLERMSENPVKHTTMLAIDDVAFNSGAGHWKCSTGIGLLDCIQKQLDEHEELADHQIETNFLPYLCTDYDIFVTEEPCFMCTMGLVQSRIRRLFYLDKISIDKFARCQQLCYPDKAIEEFYVHRDKNLNHRFEAWRVTLDTRLDCKLFNDKKNSI